MLRTPIGTGGIGPGLTIRVAVKVSMALDVLCKLYLVPQVKNSTSEVIPARTLNIPRVHKDLLSASLGRH